MNLSDETEAYAAYLNAPREHLRFEERQMLDEDTAKAKRAMEIAYLEQQQRLARR